MKYALGALAMVIAWKSFLKSPSETQTLPVLQQPAESIPDHYAHEVKNLWVSIHAPRGETTIKSVP